MKKTDKAKKRGRKMHGCTHLSRFALVSRVFPDRYAKKYTGYCIIACVPRWLKIAVSTKKVNRYSSHQVRSDALY